MRVDTQAPACGVYAEQVRRIYLEAEGWDVPFLDAYAADAEGAAAALRERFPSPA